MNKIAALLTVLAFVVMGRFNCSWVLASILSFAAIILIVMDYKLSRNSGNEK